MPRLAPVTRALRLEMNLNDKREYKNSRIRERRGSGPSQDSAYNRISMAYHDLRDFIRALEKNKELKRIPFEVDPRLEITEFADRAVKQGGPALLFEKPKGYTIPVLINAFASMRKMELALEVGSVEEVSARIVEFLEMRMPEGLLG